MKQMALPFAIVGNRKGAWLVQKKNMDWAVEPHLEWQKYSELWNSQGNKTVVQMHGPSLSFMSWTCLKSATVVLLGARTSPMAPQPLLAGSAPATGAVQSGGGQEPDIGWGTKRENVGDVGCYEML